MINKDRLMGFISGVCVALIISSGAVFADSVSKTVTAVYNNIKIVIDGEKITPTDANGNTVEPFIIDGTTYLPVRAVANALGKEVDWDASSNTVYLGKKPGKEFYQTDMEILTSYSKKPLLSVGGIPVNGGIVNFYVAQDASENNLRNIVDNFSLSGNLQTFTINGKTAATAIVENATSEIHLIYAGCAEAEKTGYAERPEVKKEIDTLFKEFMENFSEESEVVSFCESFGISTDDLEPFAKKTFLLDSFINSIIEENLQKEIDTEAAEKEIRNTYITAKHILVKDEKLAIEIIKKLDGGADFDALMKEHNTDPGATAEGYTFTKGEMVAPFEEAAFALAENTYTKTPVKTSYGYHIIYRMPFDESYMSQILYNYRQNLAFEAVNDYIEELKKKYPITYTPDYETYVTTIK